MVRAEWGDDCRLWVRAGWWEELSRVREGGGRTGECLFLLYTLPYLQSTSHE